MDLEETVATLLFKNEQLEQENIQLRSMLGIIKENVELKARMQASNNDSLEELTGIVFFSTTRWPHRCILELSG